MGHIFMVTGEHPKLLPVQACSNPPAPDFPAGRLITWRIPETSQVSPQKMIFTFTLFSCMVLHGFILLKKKKRGLGGFRSYIGPLSFSGPSRVCKAPGPGFFLFFFCLFFCLFNILLSFRSKKKKWTKLYEKHKLSYFLTLYDPILYKCKSKSKL